MNKSLKTLLGVGLAALAFASAGSASAATQIFATGYDTPNGDGQALAGGTFNYWDKNYSGSGSTTTGGAALTGGSGDLTDGLIASGIWNTVENVAGTGPYVGWRRTFTTDPLLTFFFSGAPTITDIGIHLDNSGLGGVFAPTAILVDGVSQAFTAPGLGTIGWVNLTGLSLTGGSHTIQFNQAPTSNWVFVSEVTFAGSVPEPASWALMIAGFGLVGSSLRSRNRRRTAKVSFA